ncbi:hypothetical protein [Streptomyces sp. ST2-7A]|uniref:hypothetical protein n=1 Tax=Streptomyces sp. ST2-7A TaxID=2907214 RepID=UPI001F1F7B0A|nr:hypothetical protein [Streptomyces sp. ST2-7A]MCE7080495.1 hypothetical protein [Streptomyces sp. ST2-7A]
MTPILPPCPFRFDAPECARALTAESGQDFVLLPSYRRNLPNRGYSLLLADRHVPDLGGLPDHDLPTAWWALGDATKTVRRTGFPGTSCSG